MTDLTKEKYILARLLDRPKALQERIFEKLFKQAEIAKYDDVERRQYEASLKEYWDYTSTLDTAEQKGEKKKAKEIATEMKADGIPIATIAKYTGLSTKEIGQL